MTNEEIVQAYKEELRRLYGEMYANATVLFVGRTGWFYLGLPRKLRSGFYERALYPKPVRKKDLLKRIEEMRAARK